MHLQQKLTDPFTGSTRKGAFKDAANPPYYLHSISPKLFARSINEKARTIHMPIPVVRLSISRLETSSSLYTNDILKEKNDENGGFSSYATQLGTQNRIHTHRLLSDYTPIPRSMPTPPPTPHQSPNHPRMINFILDQPK
jgi:hypothetical protein